jgi:hypothetical protein
VPSRQTRDDPPFKLQAKLVFSERWGCVLEDVFLNAGRSVMFRGGSVRYSTSSLQQWQQRTDQYTRTVQQGVRNRLGNQPAKP